MSRRFVPEESATVGAEENGASAPVGPTYRPSSSAYARVAALLHESRRQAPDQLGAFLAGRVADFGMENFSVYVTDFEQRRLVPILGSAATGSIDLDDSTGGLSFTTASQVVEPVGGGERLWSVVVDGAARLGVMCATIPAVDDDARALADTRRSDRRAARDPRPVHRRLHDVAPD